MPFQRTTFSAIILSVVLIISCEPKKVERGKEIAVEAERHKVKRITSDDILAEVRAAGDSLTNLASKNLLFDLKNGLEKGGIEEAIKYCHPENNKKVDSLATIYGAKIKRVSLSPRTPQNMAPGPSLGFYQKVLKENKPLAEAKDFNRTLIYRKGIFIQDATCLKCHGIPGKDFSRTEYEKLLLEYPYDKAVGGDLGSMRGIWEITFDRKQVIKAISEKLPKKRRKR